MAVLDGNNNSNTNSNTISGKGISGKGMSGKGVTGKGSLNSSLSSSGGSMTKNSDNNNKSQRVVRIKLEPEYKCLPKVDSLSNPLLDETSAGEITGSFCLNLPSFFPSIFLLFHWMACPSLHSSKLILCFLSSRLYHNIHVILNMSCVRQSIIYSFFSFSFLLLKTWDSF